MDPDVKTPSGMLREAVEQWRRRNALPLSNASVNEVLLALADAIKRHSKEHPRDALTAIRLAVRDASRLAFKLARRDHADRKKRRRQARQTVPTTL